MAEVAQIRIAPRVPQLNPGVTAAARNCEVCSRGHLGGSRKDQADALSSRHKCLMKASNLASGSQSWFEVEAAEGAEFQ
jgi:hypothetical protein